MKASLLTITKKQSKSIDCAGRYNVVSSETTWLLFGIIPVFKTIFQSNHFKDPVFGSSLNSTK